MLFQSAQSISSKKNVPEAIAGYSSSMITDRFMSGMRNSTIVTNQSYSGLDDSRVTKLLHPEKVVTEYLLVSAICRQLEQPEHTLRSLPTP
jgi:hypothetical protein